MPGMHTVGYDGPFDTITLTHTARDRATFARGALEAARWVCGRRGWFSMRAVLGIDDPRRRPRDFFELDLEVGTPSGWTVAGPGRGEPAGQRVRFRPAAAVPEAALIAGVFDRRTTQIDGVEVELLFDRRHLRNLEFFGDAREAIEERAARHFAAAREVGLPYPYRQLTLVEVPWTLRGFGGGWRMDTARAPPGMLLIGENSLPGSRFEFTFRNPDRFENQEGGLPAAKARGLENFFANDFTGGNILVGGARNLFLYRTGAHGPEALALEALGDLEVEAFARTPALHLTGMDGFETCIVKYTTDIPKLSNWGRPLLIGPGSIHFAHTSEERIPKREIVAAIEIYQRLVRSLKASAARP